MVLYGVVWCGVVWCGVVCGTLKTRCVDSKRLHVYIRNVPVYPGNTRNMCACCRHTRGRFVCTHGGVFESTHWEQNKPDKFVRTALHHPWNQETTVNLTTSLLVFSSLLFFFSSSLLLGSSASNYDQHEWGWRKGEDAVSQKKPLTFHNVSIFCFSLQLRALFHMLTLLNL